MANYKRKRSRRQVKCAMCTDNRFGNSLKGASKRILIARDRDWMKDAG